jgi:hypothetical protein
MRVTMENYVGYMKPMGKKIGKICSFFTFIDPDLIISFT